MDRQSFKNSSENLRKKSIILQNHQYQFRMKLLVNIISHRIIFKMKYLLLFLLILPTVSNAQLLLEGGVNTFFSSTSFSETSNSTTIKHSSTFVDPGIGLEGRLGIKLPFVSIGILGLLDWQSSSTKYQPANTGILSSSTYSNTRRRFAYGPTILGHIPGTPIRIAAEYLLKVKDNFIYASPKGANPFADNDSLTGTGWGLGVGYEFSVFYAQATYRKYNFNKGKFRGNDVDLPSNVYSKVITDGMFVSFGMSFK